MVTYPYKDADIDLRLVPFYMKHTDKETHTKLTTMTKIKIAGTDSVSTDKVTRANADGQALLVTKVGEGYCAIANKCPHLGLPMSKGKIENGIITCPFHGSKFEMCTGKNVEWVETFVGIPLPGAAKKMMAMGKSATDITSFEVIQEGEDLFIESSAS